MFYNDKTYKHIENKQFYAIKSLVAPGERK